MWLGCLRGDASADALGAVGCDLEDLESVLDASIGGAAPAPHQDMPRRNLPRGKNEHCKKGCVVDPDQEPDPQDPHVFGPPGYESISTRYGSGSGSRQILL